MNTIKMGQFLKELRKEKNLTQEQFADIMNISNRTVSRWETGRNAPDLDILIEISEYYAVDLREILDGERKNTAMNKELEETVLKVADYSNVEKERYARNIHFFTWFGLIMFAIHIGLEAAGLADHGWTEAVSSFCGGVAAGVMIVNVIYASRYMTKIRSFKQRLKQKVNG